MERSNRHPVEAALYLMSIAYGGLAKLRGKLYRQQIKFANKLPCSVVSIGNITAGGTGKTPMTIYVAKRAQDFGYKVVVLSRGYGGDAEAAGGIVSDGNTILMEAETAGDEPFMMAGKLKGVPVVVGKNRFQQGMHALQQFGPDLIILDDGFQHLPLYRNLDLVLLDSRNPFGNGYLLPRGSLREPVSALARADALVLTRWDKSFCSKKHHLPRGLPDLKAWLPEKPVFRSYFAAGIADVIQRSAGSKKDSNHPPAGTARSVKEKTAFAFSGIARNDDFEQTVTSLGCRLSGFKSFPDHYAYTPSDLNDIAAAAKDAGTELIFTTEKDHARIPKTANWPVDLMVVGLDVEFAPADGDTESFDAYLKRQLSDMSKT